MRRYIVLLGLALVSLPAVAAVREGENLLVNGRFNAEQVAFPEFWTPSSSAKGVLYERTGGPERRMPAIVLQSLDGPSRQISVRQQGLTLVPGETYKLSAYIRTKGFKCSAGGLTIHNSGWTSSIGLKSPPADSDWTFQEKTFKLIASRNNEYGVAMYATSMTGEIAFADVRLEAISPAALSGSRSQAALITSSRLVPLQPLLNRIPRANPELVLKFYGALAEKPEAYEGLVTIDGNPIAPQTIPLKDGRLLVRLTGLACGDHRMKAVLRHTATRESIVDVDYPITIVDLPACDRSGIRPLNNLVAEVLNVAVEKGPAPQTFAFTNPRDGWIFVAFSADTVPPDLAVQVDDRDTLITAGTDRQETFRHLAMGLHRISVRGHRGAARLCVRSIPEIFDYPPCANSAVKENGSYDWAFMKRHILPAVTTLNGGTLPGEALTEAKARGLKWLANFNVAPVDDPANVRARMEKHAGMTQPQYDGFTSDELFFGRATIDNYTKALWTLPNPEHRLIYTWIVGKPSIPALHADFMSAALNASRGQGRLLFEAYCHPQPDEAAATAYLDDMLGETMRQFNAMFPNAAAGTGIIFGNFNQIPIISLEHDPAVDFKYFLDMQVHLVANSPDFASLATTGYWGTYYGDEELARWSFKLMRHYAVEGHKDMLSAQYGFKYLPGLLANGDFADGLNGWTAEPAAAKSVRTASIAGFGKNSEGRWHGGTAGDAFCLMVRQPDRPNRIRQTAQGLTVGKAYCLQFVTADRKDVVEKKFNPRRYGIQVELKGAEILPDRSFVHVDRRKGGRYAHNDNVAKINLNRVIFRAKSPSQVIEFNDAEAKPGEELLMNFIQLKPYLE